MATASISGEISTRMSSDSTTSERRLTMPLAPVNGVSHTATTGMPPTLSTRPWINSVTKMSGAKKIDAVVSLRLSSSCRMRGWVAIGSAR